MSIIHDPLLEGGAGVWVVFGGVFAKMTIKIKCRSTKKIDQGQSAALSETAIHARSGHPLSQKHVSARFRIWLTNFM